MTFQDPPIVAESVSTLIYMTQDPETNQSKANFIYYLVEYEQLVFLSQIKPKIHFSVFILTDSRKNPCPV